VLGAVLTVALAGAASGPAVAADPTPAPTPTQASTPSISPPSQQQIDDARAALDRLRKRAGSTPSSTTALSQVAGPTEHGGRNSVASRISDEAWWTIGAGLLVLVVASEATRLSVRRAKHRRQA